MMKKNWIIVLVLVSMLVGCGKKEANVDVTESTEMQVETEDVSGVMTESMEMTEAEVETEITTEPESVTESEMTETAPDEMYSSISGYTIYDPHNTRGLSNVRYPVAYGVAENEERPNGALSIQKYLDDLSGIQAVTIDTKSEGKVLYLTFSCGYEYNNNSMKILDILKEKDVKAAFFGQLGYFKRNPQITRRLVDEGYILGNHTASHPDFPTLSRDEMASEVYQVDKFLKDEYGYECRYFRFPSGYYSENSLDLVNDIGHRSVFWSVAYADWDTNDLKGAEYSFNIVTSRLHPGAIIVLHAVSNDNVEALGAIIDYAREKGYEFKSLDEYPWEG